MLNRLLTSLAGASFVAALGLQVSITPAGNVRTDTANTYTTGANDFTSASSLIVPIGAGYAPTANGSLGYNSTQGCWSAGGLGAINGCIPRYLAVSSSTTDTLTAATINTTETAYAQTCTIPANYLIANKVYHVRFALMQTTSAGSPTQVTRIRLGGIGGTVVYTSSTGSNSGATGQSAAIFVDIIGTAAAGASVNTITMAGSTSGNPLTRNFTVQPVAVATNASQVLTLTEQYSANTAGNSITLLGLICGEVY